MVELVAELGINHNGDLDTARKMVDIAHTAGCDYVKLQKRTIEAVYTKEELDTPRESPWGTTTREQKQGLEFTFEDLKEFDAYCKLPWFASPWDTKSVFLINQFDIPFIKVPSALITHMGLLELIVSTTDKPIIISTGMSDIPMIDRVIDILDKDRIYCIMHCTSTYPTAVDEINLNCIKTLKERYPWAKIGFSNHHPGISFMVAAAALGAEMIEFHMTLDRSSYGSDQAASIEPEGVFKLVKYVRSLEMAMGDGIKQIYESELPIMEKLRGENQGDEITKL